MARRFGRGLSIAALLLPLVVSGLTDRVLGGEDAVAASSSAPAEVRVPSPPGLGPELPKLRSRTSRTFAALNEGPNATVLSQSSLN